MSRFATRRTFLRAAAVTGTLLPAGVFAQRAFVGGLPKDLLNPEICRASFGTPVVLPEKRALKLTWNATAICTVGLPVALERGLFAKHNLDVELVNFGGSTDQLLEAIATSKADAGVGMSGIAIGIGCEMPPLMSTTMRCPGCGPAPGAACVAGTCASAAVDASSAVAAAIR